MKNKKASHVGVILSFVIFVTFLIFLFSIFGSPINFSQSKEPTLDYLETELENTLISNLTIITISLNVPEECIKIDNQEYGLAGLNAIVKDKNNEIKPSSNSGDYLYFDKEGGDFFKIYYAKELQSVNQEVSDTCYSIDSGDIKSFRKDFFYTEDKINNLKSDYESNYLELKETLGIPINTEFSFSFTNADGEIIQAEQEETSANIYARKIPVQYFNEKAEIKSGFINLKVW